VGGGVGGWGGGGGEGGGGWGVGGGGGGGGGGGKKACAGDPRGEVFQWKEARVSFRNGKEKIEVLLLQLK